MSAQSDNKEWQFAKKMLNRKLNNFTFYCIAKIGEVVKLANYWGNKGPEHIKNYTLCRITSSSPNHMLIEK